MLSFSILWTTTLSRAVAGRIAAHCAKKYKRVKIRYSCVVPTTVFRGRPGAWGAFFKETHHERALGMLNNGARDATQTLCFEPSQLYPVEMGEMNEAGVRLVAVGYRPASAPGGMDSPATGEPRFRPHPGEWAPLSLGQKCQAWIWKAPEWTYAALGETPLPYGRVNYWSAEEAERLLGRDFNYSEVMAEADAEGWPMTLDAKASGLLFKHLPEGWLKSQLKLLYGEMRLKALAWLRGNGSLLRREAYLWEEHRLDTRPDAYIDQYGQVKDPTNLEGNSTGHWGQMDALPPKKITLSYVSPGSCCFPIEPGTVVTSTFNVPTSPDVRVFCHAEMKNINVATEGYVSTGASQKAPRHWWDLSAYLEGSDEPSVELSLSLRLMEIRGGELYRLGFDGWVPASEYLRDQVKKEAKDAAAAREAEPGGGEDLVEPWARGSQVEGEEFKDDSEFVKSIEAWQDTVDRLSRPRGAHTLLTRWESSPAKGHPWFRETIVFTKEPHEGCTEKEAARIRKHGIFEKRLTWHGNGLARVPNAKPYIDVEGMTPEDAFAQLAKIDALADSVLEVIEREALGLASDTTAPHEDEDRDQMCSLKKGLASHREHLAFIGRLTGPLIRVASGFKQPVLGEAKSGGRGKYAWSQSAWSYEPTRPGKGDTGVTDLKKWAASIAERRREAERRIAYFESEEEQRLGLIKEGWAAITSRPWMDAVAVNTLLYTLSLCGRHAAGKRHVKGANPAAVLRAAVEVKDGVKDAPAVPKEVTLSDGQKYLLAKVSAGGYHEDPDGRRAAVKHARKELHGWRHDAHLEQKQLKAFSKRNWGRIEGARARRAARLQSASARWHAERDEMARRAAASRLWATKARPATVEAFALSIGL